MKLKNPIIDNRIVNDMTFAIRLSSFIENIQVNDPWSEEEKEYLLYIAKKLLLYQVSSVKKGSEEYKYLKRLDKL